MRKIFPNVLTVFRVLAIPAVVSSFYVNCSFSQYITLLIFLLACVTDFFDGYLARMWGTQSSFGRLFDPVADKLVVLSTSVMLVYSGKISGLSVVFVIITLCREILVSGIREFMISKGISVPVNRFGKLKTTTQMVAIGFLIVGGSSAIECTGRVLLFIAAVLSVYSMCLYTQVAMSKISALD